MNAEIISVGTELLLGVIANTDAQDISQILSELGISVFYHTVCGDNPERLSAALEIAKSRADIIITTGGLGPTYDDLTKETIAKVFNRQLILHQPSLDKIITYFERKNLTMTENNKKQALLPENCTVLPNDCGTAPGCALCENGTHVIMLPGPPRECLHMFKYYAKPYLAALSDQVIVSHNIRMFGIGESQMEQILHDDIEKMQNPSVAPYAKDGECYLRVTAKACSDASANQMCQPVIDKICQKLGDYVYGIDVDSLEQALVNALIDKHLTLCCAESCTGGLLSKRITDIPGSSEVFPGGVCVYSNLAKERLVGVSGKTLENYGAVSEQTARELAENVRLKFGTDIGIGITGIAGPGGGTPEKPVGLVYIGICSDSGTDIIVYNKSGSRERIRNDAASLAINSVLKLIRK